MGILYSFFLEITVEPPLTASYLSATTATLFCPGGQSIHLLLFKPLYNGNGHERMSPTAEINSRHRPEFFGDWWKSQEWSRIDPYGSFMINSGNPILIFFFHLYFTCVSTILVKFEIYFVGSHKNFSLVLLQITKFIYSPWKVKKNAIWLKIFW